TFQLTEACMSIVLDPAKNLNKARNIDRRLRECAVPRLPMTNASSAEARNVAWQCVARFDRVRTRGLFRGGSGSQGHSILESYLVHNHEFPDVAGGERQLGGWTMQETPGRFRKNGIQPGHGKSPH